MAKAQKKAAEKKKKEPKKRAEKYDPKLSINGTFSDVIAVSVGKNLQHKKMIRLNNY